jgi:hypothetical protein
LLQRLLLCDDSSMRQHVGFQAALADVIAILAVGCGGSGVSEETACPFVDAASDPVLDPAADTGPGVNGTFPMVGSMNLRFTKVSLDEADSGAAPGIPVSDGLEARLDLSEYSNGWAALITPRWGPPISAPMTVETDQVILGPITIAPIECSGYDEVWNELAIPRGGNGLLAGSFTAQGKGPGQRHTAYGSEQGVQLAMTGEGVIEADQRPPEVKLVSLPRMYPWSQIRAEFDEPVLSSLPGYAVEAHEQGSTQPVLIPWSPDQDQGPNIGFMTLLSYQGWDSVVGKVFALNTATGIHDPSHNEVAKTSATVEFVSVGPPVAVHDFASDQSTGAVWGTTSVLSGADGSACESGSCLMIGPLLVNGANEAVFAARITVTGKTRIALLYKILMDLPYPGSGAQMHVQSASGGQVTDTDLHLSGFQQGQGTSELPYGTPWTWAYFDVSGDEAGLVLYPTRDILTQSHAAMACGNDATPPGTEKIAVLVQRIEAQ